jgi:hypothetical protein
MVFPELIHFAGIGLISEHDSQGTGSPSVSTPGSGYMQAVKLICQAAQGKAFTGEGIEDKPYYLGLLGVLF